MKKDGFRVGDKVKITMSKSDLETHQAGHGGWVDEMEKVRMCSDI